METIDLSKIESQGSLAEVNLSGVFNVDQKIVEHERAISDKMVSVSLIEDPAERVKAIKEISLGEIQRVIENMKKQYYAQQTYLDYWNKEENGIPVFNKKYYDKKLQQEIKSGNENICCMFFDVDGLKAVNDLMKSHSKGDEYLKLIVSALEEAIKMAKERTVELFPDIADKIDITLSSHGGDEFVLLIVGPADMGEIDLSKQSLGESSVGPRVDEYLYSQFVSILSASENNLEDLGIVVSRVIIKSFAEGEEKKHNEAHESLENVIDVPGAAIMEMIEENYGCGEDDFVILDQQRKDLLKHGCTDEELKGFLSELDVYIYESLVLEKNERKIISDRIFAINEIPNDELWNEIMMKYRSPAHSFQGIKSMYEERVQEQVNFKQLEKNLIIAIKKKNREGILTLLNQIASQDTETGTEIVVKKLNEFATEYFNQPCGVEELIDELIAVSDTKDEVLINGKVKLFIDYFSTGYYDRCSNFINEIKSYISDVCDLRKAQFSEDFREFGFPATASCGTKYLAERKIEDDKLVDEVTYSLLYNLLSGKSNELKKFFFTEGGVDDLREFEGMIEKVDEQKLQKFREIDAEGVDEEKQINKLETSCELAEQRGLSQPGVVSQQAKNLVKQKALFAENKRLRENRKSEEHEKILKKAATAFLSVASKKFVFNVHEEASKIVHNIKSEERFELEVKKLGMDLPSDIQDAKAELSRVGKLVDVERQVVFGVFYDNSDALMVKHKESVRQQMRKQNYSRMKFKRESQEAEMLVKNLKNELATMIENNIDEEEIAGISKTIRIAEMNKISISARYDICRHLYLLGRSDEMRKAEIEIDKLKNRNKRLSSQLEGAEAKHKERDDEYREVMKLFSAYSRIYERFDASLLEQANKVEKDMDAAIENDDMAGIKMAHFALREINETRRNFSQQINEMFKKANLLSIPSPADLRLQKT